MLLVHVVKLSMIFDQMINSGALGLCCSIALRKSIPLILGTDVSVKNNQIGPPLLLIHLTHPFHLEDLLTTAPAFQVKI